MTLRFIPPLLTITVFYTAIAIALKRENEALVVTTAEIQRHSLKERRQTLEMAVVSVALVYISGEYMHSTSENLLFSLYTDTSISPLYIGHEVVLCRINFYIFESSRMLSPSILKPSHNVFV